MTEEEIKIYDNDSLLVDTSLNNSVYFEHPHDEVIYAELDLIEVKKLLQQLSSWVQGQTNKEKQ